MTQIAKETGLSRESLYKALGGDARPQFDTIMRVLKALGLRISVEPDHSSDVRCGLGLKGGGLKVIAGNSCANSEAGGLTGFDGLRLTTRAAAR